MPCPFASRHAVCRLHRSLLKLSPSRCGLCSEKIGAIDSRWVFSVQLSQVIGNGSEDFCPLGNYGWRRICTPCDPTRLAKPTSVRYEPSSCKGVDCTALLRCLMHSDTTWGSRVCCGRARLSGYSREALLCRSLMRWLCAVEWGGGILGVPPTTQPRARACAIFPHFTS